MCECEHEYLLFVSRLALVKKRCNPPPPDQSQNLIFDLLKYLWAFLTPQVMFFFIVR